MPTSSFYLFRFYNHLPLFTAYSFNTDHKRICHLIHQIFLLDICPWTVPVPISLEWIMSMEWTMNEGYFS